MECEISHWLGGERSIFYKGVKPERESSKRTISANGGLGLLQMISESDTSKEAEPQRGVHMSRCANKDVGQ